MDYDNLNADTKERFQALATNTKPLFELVKIGIFEARYNLKLALEHYYQQKMFNTNPVAPWSFVLSRLKGLIFEIKPLILRTPKAEKIKLNIEKLNSMRNEEVITLIEDINIFLDNLGLIKIDSDVYDRSDPLAEDKIKGV